ncbi:MAG: phage portal protein [Rubripirellula sp.]
MAKKKKKKRKPRKKLKQVEPRLVKAFTQNLYARYDSAQIDPEMERWWSLADHFSSRQSNKKEIRKRVRSRARYEVQENNSIAKGMLLAKTGDIVGPHGPMLQMLLPGDKGLNREIQGFWDRWANRTCMAEKLATAHNAKMTDGEAFGERVYNERLPDDEIQLDVLFSETDMWTDPLEDVARRNYDDGISVDSLGNPVSYLRLREHPGDELGGGSLETDEYDASQVIHWFRKDRPQQFRGMSEFVTCLKLFAEARRFRLATVAAAEVAASHAAVVYSDAPAFGDDPDTLDEDKTGIELERRLMTVLPAGWKMSQLKAEHPNTVFDEFCNSLYKEIGRVAQMPLNIVSGSSMGMTFSSARIDHLRYWQHCDFDRQSFARNVMDRIFEWFIQELIALDVLSPAATARLSEFFTSSIPHTWRFAPRPPLDDEGDAKAKRILWEMGYYLDSDFARDNQEDEDLFRERLEEHLNERKKIGAPLPGAKEMGNDDEGQNKGETKTPQATAA